MIGLDIHLRMGESEYPIPIFISLIVEDDVVNTSLGIFCEDSICFNISCRGRVWGDKCVAISILSSLTLSMGGHLLAELKAIILIGDASENFVECIFMDLFHWAERILIDSNLYFLMNVLSESFCSILNMMRPIL